MSATDELADWLTDRLVADWNVRYPEANPDTVEFLRTENIALNRRLVARLMGAPLPVLLTAVTDHHGVKQVHHALASLPSGGSE